MASGKNNPSQVKLAICRLVEETAGHEKIKYLGPGCLSSFESVSFLKSTSGTPNSDKFLVASNQVLTKKYLKAFEEKDKSKKRKPSVKISAEFPGTKDRRSLERIALSELYNSLEHDVFEVNGIIYISLKIKLWGGLLWKNSLLNRGLQAFIFDEESISSILASDQLQCLVFRGESTRAGRNAVFETGAYDLLQFDSVLAGDDGRFPKYFLRSDTNERFFKEDEFEEGEKPLGAVIVNKDNSHLAGFLNVRDDKSLVPVLVGIDLGLETSMASSASENSCRSIVNRGEDVPLPPENGETMQHSTMTGGLPVGASAGGVRRLLGFWEEVAHAEKSAGAGVYPLLGPGLSSESQVRVDGGDKTITDNTDHLTETASSPVEDIREDEEKMLQDKGLETNMDHSAAGENSCRSIVTSGGGVPLPPENGETMQHSKMARELIPVDASAVGVRRLLEFWEEVTHMAETMQHSKMTRGLPVGASAGGVYPLLEPGLSPESQVGVDGGDKTTADNTDHLTETACAPVEEIVAQLNKTDLDETETSFPGSLLFPSPGAREGELQTNMGSSASENSCRSIVTRDGGVLLPPENAEAMQHSKMTRGLPVGASAGGVYPLLGPGLSSENQVGVDGGNKTTVDNTDYLTETASAPVEEIVAQLNKTDLDETVPQKLFEIGGDEEKVLEEEELEANGRPSPTETSYQSLHVPESPKEKLTVDLPAKPHKEEPPRREITPDGFQPVVTNGKVLSDALNNNRPKDTRRHSFPSLEPPKKEEHAKLKRCESALSPSLLEEKTKINLSDPLSKTILDHLEILEGLSRSLDKEYKYGACKCWKHAAEYFGIKEQEYQSFKWNKIYSPTELMFEYLQTDSPETTIGRLKAGLRSIGRQDVINVLIKYEQIMENEGSDLLTDETFVSSLFDINPDVIGEMVLLLDMQKVGLKNWQYLAAQLDIPRKVFKSFETCNTTNPTEQLFELLKVHKPGLTIAELVRQLEKIRRRDVINVIEKSTKVTQSSLIKDLMGDLNLMDEVCDMLNWKPRTNKVLGWRHLADSVGMDKNISDGLEPPQEDLECPTEALVRHLGSLKPDLKIADFIWALHKIARDDVFTVLDVYLPDHCIPNLLKSCHCARCQGVTDKSPADDAEESA